MKLVRVEMEVTDETAAHFLAHASKGPSEHWTAALSTRDVRSVEVIEPKRWTRIVLETSDPLSSIGLHTYSDYEFAGHTWRVVEVNEREGRRMSPDWRWEELRKITDLNSRFALTIQAARIVLEEARSRHMTSSDPNECMVCDHDHRVESGTQGGTCEEARSLDAAIAILATAVNW